MTGRRYAYLGALLGGAVSVAANVAHSYVPPADMFTDWQPPIGAVIASVFWPVALLVAIEIMARVDWPAGRRWWLARWLGLAPVAAVAAVVSYRHMSGLLRFYLEDPLTVVIGPLAVDGLMVMATGALIATSRPVTPAPPVTDIVVKPVVSLAKHVATAKPVMAKRTRTTTRRPPAMAKPNDTDMAAVIMAAWNDTHDVATVANRVGRSARTVRRYLAMAGHTNGHRPTPAPEAKAE